MTTLSELSDLANVINHIKNTINTAGRLNKDALNKMRTTLGKLEQQFIDQVGAFDSDVSMGQVHRKIAEAKRELMGVTGPRGPLPGERDAYFHGGNGSAAVVVTPAGVESIALETNAPVSEPVELEPAGELSDETGLKSLAARLAEEKRKLQSKRKTVGEQTENS